MALDKISTLLNVPEKELSALEALTAEQQATLATQLTQAKDLQHQHVRQAFLQAVEQLPRLVRKPVLKMFEGML